MMKKVALVIGVLTSLATVACASAIPTTQVEEITQYADPSILVETDWVLANADDESVVLLDVSSNLEAYEAGHLPGAIYVNSSQDLTNPNDVVRGQILTQEALSELLGNIGVENADTVVLYDNTRNLFAARAYWVLKYYQHDDVRVYNGGTQKWVADGQELVTAPTTIDGPSNYLAAIPDEAIRTDMRYVLDNIDNEDTLYCDTRSPDEHTGTDVRAERGGTIPGSINLEWSAAVNTDGTFLEPAKLQALMRTAGFTPEKEIITFCQTGVRGAHTWFVLSELLGYPEVRNYDGSWEEYGNSATVPIEQ